MATSSNDQNLNNPTQVDTLSLDRIIESADAMQYVALTQEEYDRIAKPDPHKAYIITNAPNRKVYYGTILIVPSKFKSIYYITQIEPNEWILVKNELELHNHDHLIEICRYDTLDKAANAMAMYNKVGSHYTTNLRVYESLINYIKEEIGIDSFILSIFAIMGLSENAEFQTLIQFLMTMNNRETYNTRKKSVYQKNITIACAEEVARRSKRNPHSFYKLYNDIYNVMISNKFFSERKYKDDPTSANLGDAVDDIVSAYIYWQYGKSK